MSSRHLIRAVHLRRGAEGSAVSHSFYRGKSCAPRRLLTTRRAGRKTRRAQPRASPSSGKRGKTSGKCREKATAARSRPASARRSRARRSSRAECLTQRGAAEKRAGRPVAMGHGRTRASHDRQSLAESARQHTSASADEQ